MSDQTRGSGRSRSVRVLIADDSDLYAETLALLLGAHERIELVGRAADGVTAVELALALRPHVVLMDVNMPIVDGFEATSRIGRDLPAARVLMLTSSNAPADVEEAERRGAAGYLTKDAAAADIVRAVLDVPPRRRRVRLARILSTLAVRRAGPGRRLHALASAPRAAR